MNQSNIRNIIQFIAGFAVAKGFIADNVAQEIVAGLVALIVAIWGHFQSRTGTEGKLPPGALPLLALIGAASLFFTGCVTENPAHVRGDTLPAYVADTNTINQNLAATRAAADVAIPVIASAYPPAAIAAPFVTPGIGIIGWILFLLSGAWATKKSSDARKQEAAAAALAATVPKENHPQAIANAQTNGSTVEVATHLIASQSPT